MLECDRGSPIWSEISEFLLEHGANPKLINVTIPNVPYKINALTNTKRAMTKRLKLG